MAYVKKLKIKKAKEMLESDFGSISDIAHSLGYSNIYDFSRDFKKQVGVSPTKYIK
jgi:YesN/AraC family two-component response regulator